MTFNWIYKILSGGSKSALSKDNPVEKNNIEEDLVSQNTHKSSISKIQKSRCPLKQRIIALSPIGQRACLVLKKTFLST